MSGDTFFVTEVRLAEALNVPRKTVRDVRSEHLEQGQHFDYSKDKALNGAVAFSRAGIEAVLARLGIPAEKIPFLLPPSGGTPPAPTVQPAPAPPAEPVRPDLIDVVMEEAAFNEAGRTILGDSLAAILPPPPDSAANPPPPSSPAVPTAATAPDPEPPLDLTAPGVVEITVVRTFPTNRHIIAGLMADQAVRVRVKSSEKLRPGMVLRCAHIAEDLYELAERLPRFIGRR